MSEKSKKNIEDIPELKAGLNAFGKIASAFVDRYKIVYLTMLMIFIIGFTTYSQLPKESVPDISLNTLVVTSVYPGAAALDVEDLITGKIEDAVTGVDGVKSVDSTTSNNISTTIIEIEDGYDMAMAKMEITNAVNEVNLPDGASDPEIIEIETNEIPVMSMTVTGDYDLVELKKFGETLQSEIEKVSGIKEVDLSGGYDREIRIDLNGVKLKEHSLTISQVQNAINMSNVNMPAGKKDLDMMSYNIRVDETFKTVDDIKNLIVKSTGESVVFIKDIAEVTDTYKKPDSYSNVFIREFSKGDETNGAVYISAFRDSGVDLLGPSDEIHKIIEESKGTLIPEDVEILVTFDQSTRVKDDLNTVVNNAIGGLITVIIVLFIFIGLNEALIVSTVIPLSMFMTFIAMKYMGLTFNTISLTGFIIALGLLVDNAIVVMENVDRLRDMSVDRVRASKFGLNQVGPAIFAATMTTVAAFIPVAIVPGIMGKFLKSMPLTIIAVILSSLIVSVVVTPTLCSKFLTKYKEEDEKKKGSKLRIIVSSAFIFGLSMISFMDNWRLTAGTFIIASSFTGLYLFKEYLRVRREKTGSEGFIGKYREAVYGILHSKFKMTAIILCAVIAFAGAIATIPSGLLKLELIPPEQATQIVIDIEAPKGTMLDDTLVIVDEIQSYLYKYGDISSFTSNIGVSGENTASITLELLGVNERELSSFTLESNIREEIKNVAGADITVESKSSTRGMTGGDPISVTLEGDNLEELDHYSELYLEELKKVEGVVDPKVSLDKGSKEISISIDSNRAATYGLNVQSVASAIRTEMSGVKVGSLKENGEEIDINMFIKQDDINSISDLKKIHFTNERNQTVYLMDIAEITINETIGTISHQDGKRVVTIGSNLEEGYNVNDVSKEFNQRIDEIKLPSTITKSISGEAKEIMDQTKNMLNSFMVALLFVYLILAVQFNSLTQPVVILVSVPLALIGAFTGLIVTGNNLGFYAMFGIVALVGIGVNDAIVLIDYTNYLRSEGSDIKHSIADAVKTRFQPVIATSLTTIGGVLPLAIYNESFSQLGYALIFGLLASTVLTLLIIPIVYYGFETVIDKLKVRFVKGGTVNE